MQIYSLRSHLSRNVVMLIAGLSSVLFVHSAAAAGSPSQIALISGADQTGVVGTTLSSPFEVKVTDSNGNAVAGATVTWKITLGGGHFPTESTVTNSSGVASNTMTLGTYISWDQASATTSMGHRRMLGQALQVGLLSRLLPIAETARLRLWDSSVKAARRDLHRQVWESFCSR